MTNPISHLQEGQKLTADAEIDLFTLSLVTSATIIRFTHDFDVTWQGSLYQGMAVKMTGDKRSSSDEEGRPNIRLMNPEGVFNQSAINGDIDRAVLTRKTVLKQHVTGNVNIFRQRMCMLNV